MSHQRPNTRTNSRGHQIQSNWEVVGIEHGLYRCGNPACRREFSAWTMRGGGSNPERRIRLARAQATRHADTCTKDPTP